MTHKKNYIGIILLSAVLGFMLNIFFGRFVAAKISTWPLLNRFKILSPQAPIVINNREVVRVNDGSDLQEAANVLKSKLSEVVQVEGDQVAGVGNALNLTADGTFVTSAGAFAGSGKFFILLNDGRRAELGQRVLDPATSLVFFQAEIDNVPTASLASSEELASGDKMIVVQASPGQFSAQIKPAYVHFPQNDIQGESFSSDYPRRSFGTAVISHLFDGEVFANSAGEVVGIWNSRQIISSDVLKHALNLYLGNPTKISRPSFGFGYMMRNKNYSELSGLPQGAYIIEVSAGSAAQKAGLKYGDIITAIDSSSVQENTTLEEILQKYKFGDELKLKVFRDQQHIDLTLITGELK